MVRFQNINAHVKPKGFFGFLKWRLRTPKPIWPKYCPIVEKDHPPMSVNEKTIRVSFVGHATFLIQTASLNILTDPVWSHQIGPFSKLGPKRVSEPGIDFNKLPKIDLVLISHNHYDHMDLPTIKALFERDDPLFIMPLKNEVYLNRYRGIQIKTLDWHRHFKFNDQVQIHLEPSQHWSRRTMFDTNKALWGTFVMDTPGGCICFTGDTGYDSELFKNIGKHFPNIVLSLIPIGSFKPRWFMKGIHVNPEEAVQIHQDLNSKYSIACHFETFQLADDLYGEARLEIERIKKENNSNSNTNSSSNANNNLENFILPSIGKHYFFN